MSTLVAAAGEGRMGPRRAGGGGGKGNVGIFCSSVNEHVFGLNSGAPVLSGLPNGAPQAWPNCPVVEGCVAAKVAVATAFGGQPLDSTRGM